MLKNIGGWYRLWIVLSVIYLFVIIRFAVINFPTNIDNYPGSIDFYYKLERRDYVIDTVGDYLGLKDKILKQISSEKNVQRKNRDPFFIHNAIYDELTKKYKKLSNEELIEKLYNEYKNKINFDFSSIENEYRKNMYKLKQKRIYFIGKVFLIYFIPVIMLYLFGLSVRWIYRGFHRS
jgi:hypothetical protein